MISRSIQIYLPPAWADDLKQLWETLADRVIPEAEAGQRGTKSSKLFQMIAAASNTNHDETVRLLKQIKALPLANRKELL